MQNAFILFLFERIRMYSLILMLLLFFFSLLRIQTTF